MASWELNSSRNCRTDGGEYKLTPDDLIGTPECVGVSVGMYLFMVWSKDHVFLEVRTFLTVLVVHSFLKLGGFWYISRLLTRSSLSHTIQDLLKGYLMEIVLV